MISIKMCLLVSSLDSSQLGVTGFCFCATTSQANRERDDRRKQRSKLTRDVFNFPCAPNRPTPQLHFCVHRPSHGISCTYSHPSRKEFCKDSLSFGVLSLRRLRLPLPLCVRSCRWRPFDTIVQRAGQQGSEDVVRRVNNHDLAHHHCHVTTCPRQLLSNTMQNVLSILCCEKSRGTLL